jgi:ATP-dependent DNA helicase DinG
VAEAGTGVGKTFAYLVPLLLAGAARWSAPPPRACRTSSSCATCRAGEQLNVPVRTACSRAAASYLCRHRLQQARHGANCPTASRCARWHASRGWAQATRSGDLAEIEGLDERSPVIPLVTSHARQLPGHRLPGVPRLPRGAGPARGDGGRPGGRQPPPVLRRPGAARQRRGRAAAHGGRRDVRRGAPAGRRRRAVPRGRPWARRRRWTSRATCWRWGWPRRAAWRLARLATAPSRRARATCGWPVAGGTLREVRGLRKLRWDERPVARLAHGAAGLCWSGQQAAQRAGSSAWRDRPRLPAAAAAGAGTGRDGAALHPSGRRRPRALDRPLSRSRRAWSSRRWTSATCWPSSARGRRGRGSSPRPRWATTTRLTWFTSQAALEDAATLRVGAPSTTPPRAGVGAGALSQAQRIRAPGGGGHAGRALRPRAGRAAPSC